MDPSIKSIPCEDYGGKQSAGFYPVERSTKLSRMLITRFLRDFWHQFNRQKLSEPANFVTYRVLRLQKGTVSARYVRLFIAFWLSGLIHALTDVAEGYTWQASGSLRYFCTQVLGIMFEDGVQSVYRSLRGLDESPGRQPERWAKVAGYAWVVAFQIWSVPVWVYPALVRNKGEAKDWIIPISFFKMLTA